MQIGDVDVLEQLDPRKAAPDFVDEVAADECIVSLGKGVEEEARKREVDDLRDEFGRELRNLDGGRRRRRVVVIGIERIKGRGWFRERKEEGMYWYRHMYGQVAFRVDTGKVTR